MPLGCLSDASKMPSWRNLQAAEQPVYGRRSLSCRRQHVGLQGLKKKRICHTQPRKPSGIGTRSDREISKDCLQIRRTQFVLASLQPYILSKRVRDASIYASKKIAQVSILERYFFVSTYQAAGPDTCLAVFVVASLPLCL